MIRQRWLLPTLILPLLALGCGGAGQIGQVAGEPRWACPSPTPRPYGEAGPPKELIHHTRTITEGGDWDEPVYYAPWEQEYPDAGEPFPSPTPYAMVGTSYALGQRVEIAPFHLQVSAAPARHVAGGRWLQRVRLAWVNHLNAAMPIGYGAQVRLEGVRGADGAVHLEEFGYTTDEAQRLAGLAPPPESIAPGASKVELAFLSGPGEAATVAVSFLADRSLAAATPQALRATPTPNAGLRAASAPLTVRWVDTELKFPGAAPCDDPGALTGWSHPKPWGWHTEVGMVAPEGGGRLIEIVLAQVGRPYVWGAKGPQAFDCSGLASWSYGQIGVRIPNGTANQLPAMRPVTMAELAPGDLVFFALGAPGEVDHVGVLVGDLDGDGRWDMVHAANPEQGVRLERDVFGSRYYGPRVIGLRSAR